MEVDLNSQQFTTTPAKLIAKNIRARQATCTKIPPADMKSDELNCDDQLLDSFEHEPINEAVADNITADYLLDDTSDVARKAHHQNMHSLESKVPLKPADDISDYNLDLPDRSVALVSTANNLNRIQSHSPTPTESDFIPQHQIVWKLMSGTTVGQALASATKRLQSLEILTPQLDAQVILARLLGHDRSWLFAHHDHVLSDEELDRFVELIARRTNYEPVAYLIGCKEFYGLEFIVDQRVLIPRPETELLVDAVLDHVDMRASDLPPGKRLRVADIGTGSGAIAVAVAVNSPNVEVYATDVSTDALEIARLNIKGLDKRCQVSLLEGDLLTPLANKIDLPNVNIIVANLPYITLGDYADLQRDVRDYEPRLALAAGPEGLDTICRLLEQAPDYLEPDGVILLEIGADQGAAVVSLAQELVPQANSIILRQDHNGRDRLVMIAM